MAGKVDIGAWFSKRVTGFIGLILSVVVGIFVPLTPFGGYAQKTEPVEKFSIIENGSSAYEIIVGADCAPTEMTAAKTLQSTLKQISSVELPIFTDARQADETEIIVGKTNRESAASYVVDREKLGDEGTYIRTLGSKLILSGGEKRGVIYAVYTFLEDYLGCRWFTFEDTLIPAANKVEIPKELNCEYVPPLEYRYTDWYSSSYGNAYCVANKINRSGLGEENGGGIDYTGGLCHTFTTTFCNPDKYFAEYPEIYAVHDGERVKTQLCLTNPKTMEIVIEEVQALLNQYPDAKIISLTQWDDDKYCECAQCAALDAQEESHQGTNLSFVNAVARHFAQAYPELQFDTFAYWYTRKPPKTLVPEKNVLIRLCSIECCFSHALDDEDCSENAAFAQDIKKWSEISNKLYVWDYTTNYSAFNGPFPNFNVLQKNIQFFIKHNVKGVFEEGMPVIGGEFGELRNYVLGKLMWNPDGDYGQYMRDFCTYYYGDAAEHVLKYIKFSGDRAASKFQLFRYGKLFHKDHMSCFSGVDSKLNIYSSFDAKRIDALWREALSMDLTDAQMLHLRRSEIQWRYFKASARILEFSENCSEEFRLQNAQRLYDDMIELGLSQQYLENYSVASLAKDPDLTNIPKYWIYERGQEVYD